MFEGSTGCSKQCLTTGWVPPSWNEFAAGARPEVLDPDQFELWDPQRGWQYEAASRIESWWLDEFVFQQLRVLLSNCPYPCPCILAGVAAHSFSLATTALPVHGQGSGKRRNVLESVVARICREAGGRVTTNVLLRELDFGLVGEADGRHLQSTPPWSVHCTVMAGPDRVQPTHREWFWRQQSGKTRSWLGQERDAGWWCSEWKLGADGRGNPKTSSARARDENRRSSDVGPKRLGASVGVPWCPVWWHGQWQIRCWASLGLWELTGTLHSLQDVVRDLQAAGFAW